MSRIQTPAHVDEDAPSVTCTSRTDSGTHVTIGLTCLDLADHTVSRLIQVARGFDRISDVRHASGAETFIVTIDVQYIEPDETACHINTTTQDLLAAFKRVIDSQRSHKDDVEAAAATRSTDRAPRESVGSRSRRHKRVPRQ